MQEAVSQLKLAELRELPTFGGVNSAQPKVGCGLPAFGGVNSAQPKVGCGLPAFGASIAFFSTSILCKSPCELSVIFYSNDAPQKNFGTSYAGFVAGQPHWAMLWRGTGGGLSAAAKGLLAAHLKGESELLAHL